MDKSFADRLILDKREADFFKLEYLTDLDMKICDYVIKILPHIRNKRYSNGKEISLEKLKESSVRELKIFGEDIYFRLSNLFDNSVINSVYGGVARFNVKINVKALSNKDEDVIGMKDICCYLIPTKIYEISALYMAHEHIHVLKDTRYNEFREHYILGEVIPIFYELISFKQDDVLRKKVLLDRMVDLYNNKQDLLVIKKVLLSDRLSSDELDLYKYLFNKIGVYLNSFYYAILLYSMYQKSQLVILELVSRVLKQEITTLELLKLLNIYGVIDTDNFKNEVYKIKKLLK